MQQQLTSTTATADHNNNTTKAVNAASRPRIQGMQRAWGGELYNGDVWPTHFTETQVRTCEKRYQNIHEEFHTKSRFQVVTPDNFELFMKAHEKLNITWVLQEQWSGSGRVSLEGCNQQLAVLFPVGLGSGWYLSLREHREKITRAQAALRPIAKYSSPDCRLWTSMSNARDQHAVQQERQQEIAQLEWLVEDNRAQAQDGHGYANENGLRSQIWTQSPLSKNATITGNRTTRCNGCAHGLENSMRQPV